MPPKRRTSAAPHASKRTRSSNAIAINNTQSAPDIVVSTASRDQLLSLSARELRSQLLAYSLPNSGNKAALADRLYHYFHTSNEAPNNLHCSTTAASLLQPTHGNFSHMDSSVFNPEQFARQLSDLLRHLTPATLQSSGVMQAGVTTTAATTSDNQPPTPSTTSLSTSNQLPPTLPLTINQQVDDVLSAASPNQPSSPTTVNNHTALLNCALPPTLPTLPALRDQSTLPALRDQPTTIANNTADVSIHTRYLPPVPPKVRERVST